MKKIIKDYTYQDYREDDEKDFEIRTIQNEKLIDILPERDDEQAFNLDMYNFGDAEDLPDSDRLMACQTQKIKQTDCLNL